MAKRRPKKWLPGAIKRPGALRAYAKRHGGMTKQDKISRSWALKEQRRLRRKKKRTAADVRALRQLSLYLNQLSKGKRRR